MAIALRRGWWKPWNWSTRNWLFAICFGAIALPFVSRWICLWQVPDVALPFNIDEFINAKISADQQAFTKYAGAAQMLIPRMTSWLDASIDDAISSGGAQWDDRLDRWLIDNGDILAEIESGTELPEINGGMSLKTIHIYTLCRVHQELRKLARLLAVKALRSERSGDLEAAWNGHRARLKLALHAATPGFAVACAIGRAIRGDALSNISSWAAHPSLTPEQLEVARIEISTDAVSRITISETAKVEYIMIKNTLEQTDPLDVLVPQWKTGSRFEPMISTGTKIYLWTIGQPELSLRISRQLLVNQLESWNQPRHLRPNAIRSEYPMIFATDFEKRPLPGQLAANQINRALHGPIVEQLIRQELFFCFGSRPSTSVMSLDEADRIDRTRLAMIDVLFACHKFERIHGEFPATLEQLVPAFLDAVPLDLMSQIDEPLHYRRDEQKEAKIWSLGRDEHDDGGDIEGKEAKDQGYRLFITNEVEPQAKHTD